jgi:hypothetical protein
MVHSVIVVDATRTREDHAMSNNIAVLEGYTQEIIAESDAVTLYLLIRPDTDLDDTFKAWDTDEQEFIRVNGWLFTFDD